MRSGPYQVCTSFTLFCTYQPFAIPSNEVRLGSKIATPTAIAALVAAAGLVVEVATAEIGVGAATLIAGVFVEVATTEVSTASRISLAGGPSSITKVATTKVTTGACAGIRTKVAA